MPFPVPDHFWKLDETGVGTLVDQYGGCDLTVHSGSCTRKDTGLPAGIAHGIEFDAGTDWALIATPLTQVATDQFSVAYWVEYITGGGFNFPLFCASFSGGHTDPYYTFGQWADGGSRVVVDTFGTLIPWDGTYSNGDLSAGGVYHLYVMSYDGANITIYIDGTQVAQQSRTGNVGDMGSFAINNIPALNSTGFAQTQYASMFGYWADYALTSSDVTDLFAAGSTDYFAFVDSGGVVPPAAPEFITEAHAANFANSGTLTISAPIDIGNGPMQDGDVLIAVVGVNGGTGINDASSLWTKIGGGSGDRYGVFRKIAASESGGYTFTCTSGVGYMDGSLTVYRASAPYTSDPIEDYQETVPAPAGTSQDFPSVTVADQPTTVIYGTYGDNNADNPWVQVPPAGGTNRSSEADGFVNTQSTLGDVPVTANGATGPLAFTAKDGFSVASVNFSIALVSGNTGGASSYNDAATVTGKNSPSGVDTAQHVDADTAAFVTTLDSIENPTIPAGYWGTADDDDGVIP